MAETTVHTLKTLPQYFEAIERGEKTFEVRRNDRGFQKGDLVVLKKLDSSGRFYDSFNRELTFRIGWLLQGGQFGIEPGFCVFSLDAQPKDSDHG